ncbi:transposase [Embleya sp. NPDC005971]|uniref:transposase n=1 Tax=Embleya sp. NPDC005971 TaxID=3156724 RepID=UPI0033FE9DEB
MPTVRPSARLCVICAVGSAAHRCTPGARFGPFQTVSFDGCSSIEVPDSERNRDQLGRCPHGGYPLFELMTLVETSTRAGIAAVFGPTCRGEISYATALLEHLGSQMLVLWDRGFDGNDVFAAVHSNGAQILGRIKRWRRLAVLRQLPDSSYLSVIGGVPVRVIEARSVTCSDGSSFDGTYRLATTLLDARRYPARRLVLLYHERWEHESAYYTLRHTIGRALSFKDFALVWAAERGLSELTVDLYGRLLRLHILPTFGDRISRRDRPGQRPNLARGRPHRHRRDHSRRADIGWPTTPQETSWTSAPGRVCSSPTWRATAPTHPTWGKSRPSRSSTVGPCRSPRRPP